MDYQKVLDDVYVKFKDYDRGDLPDYIPELASANPNKFSLSLVTIDGQEFQSGDSDQEFTIQSISKPFMYGMMLEKFGEEKIELLVGVEPTGEDFNDIVKLDKEKRVMNPMVNSGAITISSLVPGISKAHKEKEVLSAFSHYAGRQLRIDSDVYYSEKSTAYKNRAIANLLKHFGILNGELDEVLDLYFKQCSISVTTKDLAYMGATLANEGINPKTQKKLISRKNLRNTLSVMLTCGMYNYSGHWAYDIGVPAKSGVSGGIMMTVPGLGGISIYSPRLDERGNSARGIEACEALSQKLNLHLLDYLRPNLNAES